MRFVPLLLLALPLVEIALFVIVGQAFGLVPTLLGVVVGALLGVLVIRAQGLSVMSTLRDMAAGGARRPAIGDAVLVGIAGALLIVPGYFSDAVALVLLLPPVRKAILGALAARVSVRAAGYRPAPEQPRIVELGEDDWRRN